MLNHNETVHCATKTRQSRKRKSKKATTNETINETVDAANATFGMNEGDLRVFIIIVAVVVAALFSHSPQFHRWIQSVIPALKLNLFHILTLHALHV